MKKLSFLALAAAGLLMVGCSDKDVVAETSMPNEENGGGNYIAIGINLPSVYDATRGSDNNDNGGNVDELNDGMPSEYAVKNATLIIFGSDGAFKWAGDIDTKPWEKNADPHVTTVSTKIVKQVGGSVAKGDQMLVILNDNGFFDVTSSNGLQVMKYNSTTGDYELTDFTGNFSDLTDESKQYFANTTGLDCGAMNTNGFFMANAPLADKQGSTSTAITGANVLVLVPISKVYETQAAASAGTADQIYVERGMAKVTMEQGSSVAMSNSKVDGTTTLNATVTGWTIDNCNPQSFLVRSTDNHSDFLALKSNATTTGAAVYRYIGDRAITAVGNGGTSVTTGEGESAVTTVYKYRTYFAKSANYDKSGMDVASPTFSLNRVSSTTPFSSDFGDENPQYCFENTFSVDDQDVNKTTLVQVAIQAIPNGTTVDASNPAPDLYTINGNKTTIYNLTSLTTIIQNKALEYIDAHKNTMFTFGESAGSFTSTGISVGTITVNDKNEVTGIELSIPTLPANVTEKASGSAFSSGSVLIDAVNNYVLEQTGTILKYVNGISYYNIRIKHFGDVLTEWNGTETPKPRVGAIYPTTEADGTTAATNRDGNYLGRYGVLRNNWYNLKVKSIRGLGEATPHTINWPSTPDDELDSYITFQINILSWAKHVTQEADL